jgi:hypothetical protein
MTAVLLANSVSTFFMLGLTWFVQVVHYPLFPFVGRAEFPGYHDRHSKLTAWLVLPPMIIELLSSILLALNPPAGKSGLALAGAVLAVLIWALTALLAAPAHGRIGRDGLNQQSHARLLSVSWVRSLLWTAHAVVVVILLAAVMSDGS